jgi:Tfp pilus assembly protein PilN
MIKINLLPREIYAAKAAKQLQMVGASILAMVVLLMLGFFSMVKAKERSVLQQLRDAQAEEVKYKAIADEVQQLEVKKQQLSTRFSVIQQLVSGTLTYPKFFEDFMALLPSDVWAANISTITDASYGLDVTVSASALSTFAIADWLTNLQTSPLCSNVRLGAINATEETEGKASVYTFTMTFHYQRSN